MSDKDPFEGLEPVASAATAADPFAELDEFDKLLVEGGEAVAEEVGPPSSLSNIEQQRAYDKKHSTLEQVGMGLDAGMASLKAAKAFQGATNAAEDLAKTKLKHGDGMAEDGGPKWRQPVKSVISGSPGELVDPLTGAPLVDNANNPLSMRPAAVRESLQRKSDLLSKQTDRFISESKKSSAIEQAPIAKAAMEAKTFGEAWDAVKQDPIAFILDTGTRSAPFMVEPIVTGLIGSIGGIPGFMAGSGLGSAHTDYSAELSDALSRRGVDMSSRDAIRAALLDPKILSSIRGDAAAHAAFVGTFDGLTAGLASKMLAPKLVSQPMAREFVNLVNQFGAQSLGGMAGEAGGQWAATGEVHSPGAILGEGLGEGMTAPMDVATASITGLRKSRQQKEIEAVLEKAFNERGDLSALSDDQLAYVTDFANEVGLSGEAKQIITAENALRKTDAGAAPAVASAPQPAQPSLQMRPNGQPYTSKEQAETAARLRGKTDHAAIEVDGGWALAKPGAAEPAAPVAAPVATQEGEWTTDLGASPAQSATQEVIIQSAETSPLAAPEGTINYQPVKVGPELTTELGAAPESANIDPGIPFATTPNLTFESRADANKRVAQDGRIANIREQLGEAKKPEGLGDERIGRLSYRSRLKGMANTALPNTSSSTVNPQTDELMSAIAKLGGISIDEAKAQGIDPDHFKDRPGRRNPFRAEGKSFDAMAELLSEHGYTEDNYTANGLLDKVSSSLSGSAVYSKHVDHDALQAIKSLSLTEDSTPQEAQAAIAKALKGESLGVRQARIVKAALDAVSGERRSDVDAARADLERARADRRAVRQGFAPLAAYEADDAIAGEIFEESAYDPEWDAHARTREEWFVEADQIDPEAAYLVAEDLAGDRITEKEAVNRLLTIIAGGVNVQESATRTQGSAAAYGAAEAAPQDGQPAKAAGRDAGAAPAEGSSVSGQVGDEVAGEQGYTDLHTENERLKAENERLRSLVNEQSKLGSSASSGTADSDGHGERDLSGGEAPRSEDGRAGTTGSVEGLREGSQQTPVSRSENRVDQREEQRTPPTTAKEVWREALSRRWDAIMGNVPSHQSLPVEVRRQMAHEHLAAALEEQPLPIDPTSGLIYGKEAIEPGRLKKGEINGTMLEGVINALIQHVKNGGTGSFGVVDLGNLGGINHWSGQDGGDKAIADLAGILQEHSGSDIDLARQGGDEFMGAQRDGDFSETMRSADKQLQEYMRKTTPRMLNPGLEMATKNDKDMSEAEKNDIYRFLDTPLVDLPGKPKYHSDGRVDMPPGGTRMHIGKAVTVSADSVANDVYKEALATLTTAKNRNKAAYAAGQNKDTEKPPAEGAKSIKQTPADAGVFVSGEETSTPSKVSGKESSSEPSSSVDTAAHEAATSPKNDLPEPTEAQKEAGNYQKGHITLHGLDISIENPAGTKRRHEWPALKHHYGYIKGTVGKDGDHVDVFIGPQAEDAGSPVVVIDQLTADGKFDEHKVMMGFPTREEAIRAYFENYEPGWDRVRSVKEMSVDELKAWAGHASHKLPVGRKMSDQQRSYLVRKYGKQVKAGDQQAETAPESNTSQATKPSQNAASGEVSTEKVGGDQGTVSGYGKSNKVFTEDAANKARELLRQKLNQLNSGLDPEMVQAGISLAGYHIEAGARSFSAYSKAMVEDLGNAVRPYLRAWYEAVRYYPGYDSEGMSTAQEIEAQKGAEDVGSSRADLERDSADAAAGNGVGQEALSDEPAGNDRGRREGVQATAGQRAKPRRSGKLSDRDAAASGEGGDLSPFAEAPGAAGRAAGDQLSERGGDIGIEGSPAESVAAEAVTAEATGLSELARKRKAQKTADAHPVTLADKANIDDTLPFLNDGQRADVLFAEQRFAKPDGYGVLFTNGTGTGKTATGMGVIKRFARQGKTNTLIAVPSDKIANDWIAFAKHLGLDVSLLPDTKSAGDGIVVTTYANLGQNRTLADRQWDLVVADESHYLMQSADGKETNALTTLRAITLHPRGVYARHDMLYRKDIDERNRLNAEFKTNETIIADGGMGAPKAKAENARLEPRIKALDSLINKTRDEVKAAVAASQGEKRPRAVLLSATPWAYEKAVDYAEGYLFDYPDDGYIGNSRQGGFEKFMVENFGYRIRYHKLTEPDAYVDRGLMQRQFNSRLKKDKVLSGRALEVPHDYDRRFILTESAIGQKIDEGLDWLWNNERMGAVHKLVREKFDHLTRRYLLEAIKAQEVIPLIRDQLAAGRKVVVFHDFKKGGGFNPFDLSEHQHSDHEVTIGEEATTLGALVREYMAARPDLQRLPLANIPSPIHALSSAFPDLLLFNGDVPKAQRRANVEQFQDDSSGKNLILVQSAAGKEGISLHDTTGKHQRILYNLGLPTQPTTAIQQEGRVYRTGQASDAMFRYLNTGTNWERWAFADTIARRSSTAENLALGEQARALMDGFIQAFEESDSYPVGHDGEGKGGKERDAAANAALSDWDRAMTLYFAQHKRTSKTKALEGVDYFATAEPLGLKVVEWSDIRPEDEILEPSAGHGAIARWFPENNRRTVIEPSPELGSRLKMVSDAKLLQQRFEDHHIVNKYDVITTNPPFGVGGKTAMEHLAKDAIHLRDGGRITAIIPTGPAADKRFEKWLYETDEKGRPLDPSADNMHLVAEIKLPSVTFERAGTKVATRVVILDKVTDKAAAATLQTRHVDLTHIDSINELFSRLESMEMPARFAPKEEAAAPAGVSAMPAQGVDAPANASGFMLGQTKHTKTGEDLYVATIKDRVERDEYTRLNSIAKKHGGWYSSFKGGDAIPGFQFKTENGRQSFLDEVGVNPGSAVFSRRPRFYSQLDRAIESAPDKAFGKAAQTKLWLLANTAKLGIKQDELQWSGVLDYLDMRKGEKVSKEEVAAFLSESGVQVQDAVKGAGSRRDLTTERNSDGTWSVVANDGEVLESGLSESMADSIVESYWNGDGNTKFAQYVPPGGVSGTYREILVTLPVKNTLPDGFILKPGTSRKWEIYHQEHMGRGRYAHGETQEEAIANFNSMHDKGGFKSSHWDEPNILVHLRTDEVTGADGKRYLRVIEIQSDWGQKGKKEGFAGVFPQNVLETAIKGGMTEKQARSDIEDLLSQPTTTNGVDRSGQWRRLGAATAGSGIDLNEVFHDRRKYGVPAAPFVTDTRAWVALGIKRAIMQAVNSGVDGVVFATGQQNADLYDLSKTLSEIQWSPDNEILIAWDKQGKRVIERTVPESELEDVVGKDVAARLIDPSSFDDETNARTMRGDNLKVGGEGMRTFYDKIVPSVANEVLKKIGGGKVADIDVKLTDMPWSEYEKYPVGHPYREKNAPRTPGFLITDALRNKVQTDGLPLFGRSKGWGNFPDAVIAANLGAASEHPDYRTAKAGDTDAAYRLVRDVLPDSAIEQIRKAIGDSKPVIVPVHAMEAAGQNKIPILFAEVLGEKLGLKVDAEIVQSRRVKRTLKDGFFRLATQPTFDGDVTPQDYILVDDTITQGGTIAQLKEHIESRGGRVILAAALTGKQYSAKLAPSEQTLSELRDKYGNLEQWWRDEFGYGFDGLTESEARYILKSGLRPDAIRDRVAEGRREAGISPGEGADRSGYSGGEVLKSLANQEAPALSGASASEVAEKLQATFDAITAKLPSSPNVHVIASMDEAPADVREDDQHQRSQGAADADPEGFYYPRTGEVYIVLSGVMPRRGETYQQAVFRVFAHEVMGHAGLRGLFGKQLDPILREVALKRRKDVLAKAREYGLDISNEEDRLTAAEEVLAEMAESAPENSLVVKAIEAIRRALRALYLRLPKRVRDALGGKAFTSWINAMTDAEMIDLFIVPARRYVNGGGTPPPSGGGSSFSRRRSHLGNLTPQQEASLRNVGGIVTPKGPKQYLQELRNKLAGRMAQGMVDQFAPIKDLDSHAYTLARLSKASDGALEALLMFGNLNLKDGVTDTDAGGTGLIEVLQQLQGEQQRFMWWIAANRAEGLKAEGRENLFTDEDITALKSLNQGAMPNGQDRANVYADVHMEFNRISKEVMDIAEESGLIDPESRQLWERDFYIPFYRVMEEGKVSPTVKGGLVKQYAFKRLQGGTEKLNDDLLANTLMNWGHLIAASAKNRAATAALEAAEDHGVAIQLAGPQKGSVYVQGMREVMIPAGTKYMENGVEKVSDGTATIMEHGEIHYMVIDPLIMDAITSLEWSGFNNLPMKAAAKAKHWLTMGVTANPTFKIRNLIRDSLQAIAIANMSYNVAGNVSQGWKVMSDKKSQTFASLLAGGGIIRFGSMLDGNRASHVHKLINAGVHESTILDTTDKLKAVLTKSVDWYNDMGDRSEGVNRAAIYLQQLEKGASHAEATMAARDLLDFSMGGGWGAVRALTQTVPFLNARMQGLYKLGKSAKADKGRFAVVTATMALASIALLLKYHDDDEWKKREDWDRDNYWWFRIGDTAYRIPKPFEVGAIATLAERGAELWVSDEMTAKRFYDRLEFLVGQTFAFNPTPQIVKPAIDVYANHDSFTDRPIESMGMERMSKPERFNHRTSETAKFLGKAGNVTGLSPVQIDHLIRGYFGWLGTFTTQAVDNMADAAGIRPAAPSLRLKDAFVVGNFAETLPAGSSRYLTVFYDQAKELNEYYADLNAARKRGDKEKSKEIIKEHKGDLVLHSAMNEVQNELAELTQMERSVRFDAKMSAADKRKKLDKIAARKGDIAAKAVRMLERRRDQ